MNQYHNTHQQQLKYRQIDHRKCVELVWVEGVTGLLGVTVQWLVVCVLSQYYINTLGDVH